MTLSTARARITLRANSVALITRFSGNMELSSQDGAAKESYNDGLAVI